MQHGEQRINIPSHASLTSCCARNVWQLGTQETIPIVWVDATLLHAFQHMLGGTWAPHCDHPVPCSCEAPFFILNHIVGTIHVKLNKVQLGPAAAEISPSGSLKVIILEVQPRILSGGKSNQLGTLVIVQSLLPLLS